MTFKVKNPNPRYCAADVHDIFGAGFHQCGNKPKPDSVFCGTHSPEADARREAKSKAGYQAWKDKALAPSRRIEHLEAINRDLLAALEGLLRLRGLDLYGLNDDVFAKADAAIAKAELPA